MYDKITTIVIILLSLNSVFTFFIYLKQTKIMSTQLEISQELTVLTATVTKIGEESKTTLQKVTSLEAELAKGEVTPELQAAFDALKVQVVVVDDLVPDATPPTI